MKKTDARGGANSIARLAFVGISVVAQTAWLMVQVMALNRYSVYISLATSLMAAAVVLKLHSKHTTSAMKMPWIMLILVFPVMGLALYLLIVVCGDPGGTKKRLTKVRQALIQPEASEVPEEMGWCRSLAACGNPVYADTDARYFPEAADAFKAMKQDLEQAEKFIFMEYFIVEDGEAFHQIEEILARKAAQGVEVRLMYDDVGSIGVADFRFVRRLNQAGIQCRVFNPARPFLNLFMNHRDHRKITVIDGKVGYTGGYNLAGEYFGYAQPYGNWKDAGLRLEGRAVRSLTATFLELWNLTGREVSDGASYLHVEHGVPTSGQVLAFGDDPLQSERKAEDLYLNLIGSAKDYIWFMTPYLIITDEMTRMLGLAAKRGVDVRIITPGIPDKKTVYQMTRSYYSGLLRQGVRIFEYTPGFCHGKLCVRDGETAVVGTTNLDYRSLYLHFENNVILHRCDAVGDIEKDFQNIFPQCREVTSADRPGGLVRLWQSILRPFAPMM